MKTIEEQLNRVDTYNLKDEYKTSLKINRYGGEEDSKAWAMINELRGKNISVSKHIRMLLALEYEGKILLPKENAIKQFLWTENEVENSSEEIAPTKEVVRESVKETTTEDVPNHGSIMDLGAFSGM